MKEYFRRITVVLPSTHVKKLKKGASYTVSLSDHYARYLLTALLLLFLLLSWQLYDLINTYTQTKNERAYAINRLTYWNKVIENHANFPDAYYQAAAYSYSLGDTKRAGELLDKALFLDPEFKDAMELKKRL